MSEVIQFIERRQKKCHHGGGIIFDPDEAFAECKLCEAKLTLGFALERMIRAESRASRMIARGKLVAEELAKRTKTKCQHCKKMTDIRLNIPEWKVIQGAEV